MVIFCLKGSSKLSKSGNCIELPESFFTFGKLQYLGENFPKVFFTFGKLQYLGENVPKVKELSGSENSVNDKGGTVNGFDQKL